jgi:hypothetical protein
MTESVNMLEAQVAAMEFEDYRLNRQLAESMAEVAALEDRIAWEDYGSDRLNKKLATRNSVEGSQDILVCNCRKCLVARRFGTASAAGIWRAFSTGGHDGECIVKRCLKHQCEKAGLICMECDAKAWGVGYGQCHIALVDSGDAWHVRYGSLLTRGSFFGHPMYPHVQSVFDSISGPHIRKESDGWNLQTESAICSMFGIQPTDPHGFFVDATGIDYVAEAIKRE